MKESIYFLAIFLVVGCNLTTVHQTDYEKLATIDNYNKYLFSLKLIDSRSTLDSLRTLADTVFADTASYTRTPKATLYVNRDAGTINQVFEKPRGTITAIAYQRAGKQIYVAEYYENGHVMCKFSVMDNGIRHGHDTCYYKNGALRHTGFHMDDKPVEDSTIQYTETP